MTVLDGKKLSEKIHSEVAAEVARLKSEKGIQPVLATVLIGDDEASKVYVRRKNKMCAEVGILSHKMDLPVSTSEADLLEIIQKLNDDNSIDGILIQLPLPAQISTDKVLQAIHPDKDVDGFHVISVGKLAAGRPGFVPCTPLGVIRLLDEYKIVIEGAEAVVVGRSKIVGKPMAQLLLSRHATVTVCHSWTKNIADICRRADILVVAIGQPELVRGDWIKPGAAVVDVGMNRTKDGKLVGDVAFDEASAVAGWITPVPGGVGPLTIAMLLKNTVQAAKMRVGNR